MRKKGFTLVEVILSIALIGLIAVVFVPAMSNGFRLLTESEKFVVDSYVKQQDVEKLLEQKRNEIATGTGTSQISVFGKNVSGHLITINIEGHGEINAFQPERTVTYDMIEIIARGHAGNPDVLMDVVSVSPRPTTVNMFQLDGTVNTSLEFLVNENYFTVNEPTLHLLNVYRWFLTSEQVYNPSYNLDNFFVIKEWNPARGLVSFAESETQKVIPNIQNSPDYNRFKFSEVISGYSLTTEELINLYGNRFIYYSVTPYSISGRIGKEDLSNPIYINAPKIEIVRANFASNPNQIEVLFAENIGTAFDASLMTFSESLGTVSSIARSVTNEKIMVVTFIDPLDGSAIVTGNSLQKGSVASNLYGKISIWRNNTLSGDFTIDPAGTVYVTGVTLDQSAATLYLDEQIDLTETVLPLTATQKNVTWSSNNTSIAEVDAAGLVTAKAKGTARITVTTVDGGYKAYFDLTVTDVKLVLQLDAQLGIVQSGGLVSSWEDQSGLDNDFAQTTGTKRPTYVASSTGTGKPGLRFDGSTDAMVFTNSTLSGITFDTDTTSPPFTLFVVAKANSNLSNGTFLAKSDGWGSQATFALGRAGNGNFTHILQGTSTPVAGNAFFNLHASQWSGTAYGYWINQRVQTVPAKGSQATQTDVISIGATTGGTQQYLNGDISEIRIYKGALTETEITNIENTLIDKWLSFRTWTFASGVESWTTGNRISSFANTGNGTVSGNITGSGDRANIQSPTALNINTDHANRIQIRLKNSTNTTQGYIGFRIGSSSGYDYQGFNVVANSDFIVYEIDMSTNFDWNGTLNQLRILPAYNANSGSFEIDYIRVLE